MNYETVSKVFKFLYEQDKIRDKWLSSLPVTVRCAFYDNEYVNSLHNVITFLTQQVFVGDQRILQDMEYFLYDCHRGGKIITAEGVGYVFTPDNMLEEVLAYLKEVYYSE